jgi:hypothetical protein
MTIRGTTISILAVAIAAVLSGPARAQAPTQIKQNSAWGSYSAQANGSKTCYILSMPTQKQPTDRDHGDVFFMLAQHPDEASSLEPQFTVGYPFKDDSKVILDIDGKKFSMFTRGQNAWLENAGKEMSLQAQSRRGTQTSYTYSLSGVTASLKDIDGCQ